MPATAGDGSMCREKGKHSATDAKGRCLCCGDQVDPLLAGTAPHAILEDDHPTMADTVDAFTRLRARRC